MHNVEIQRVVRESHAEGRKAEAAWLYPTQFVR